MQLTFDGNPHRAAGVGPLALLLFFSLALPAQEQEAPAAPGVPPWKDRELKGDELRSALDASLKTSLKSIESIPKDARDDSAEGRRRSALSRRQNLLEEFLGILARAVEIERERNALPKEEVRPAEEPRKLELPAPPQNPTDEGSRALKAKLEKQREKVKGLSEKTENRQKLVNEIPQLIVKANEREKAGEQRAERLEAELAATAPGAEKEQLELEAGNAGLESRIAREQVGLLEAELDLEARAAPHRVEKLEFARAELDRIEQEFKVYQQSLQEMRKEELEKKEAELEQQKKEEKKATGPKDKFLQGWKTKILEVERNVSDLESFKTEIDTVITNQQGRLKNDQEQLTLLKNLVENRRASRATAKLLKNTYQSMHQRRRDVQRAIPSEILGKVGDLRSRRVEIDEILDALTERLHQGLDDLRPEIPDAEFTALEAEATRLRDDYAKLLRKEKSELVKVLPSGQRLELLPYERSLALDALEQFVISRIFWIRDAPPLGLETLRTAVDEIASPENLERNQTALVTWGELVTSGETTEPLLRTLKSPVTIVYGVLLLLVLPLLLLYLRHRLRSYVRKQNEASLEERTSIPSRVLVSLAGIAGTTLMPAYLLAAAWLLGTTDLPASLGPVAAELLVHAAAFLFLWFLNRLFFAPGAVAVAQFGMAPDTAKRLLRAFRWILLAYLVCLLPWAILGTAPFSFEALPRLGYTVFECCVAFAVFLLFRRSSPLMRDVLGVRAAPGQGGKRPGFFARNWGAISWPLTLLILAIVVLDIGGYRFGAWHLAKSTLLTLVTAMGLVALYRLLLPAVRNSLRRRRRAPAAPPGEDSRQTRFQIENQVHRFLQVLFSLTGIFLFAVYWGIDKRAVEALSELTLYSITSGEATEFVSAADVLKALIAIVLTIWILRNLPSIYELAVFPRFQLDSGLRYALLTISRYGVFIVGLLVALSAVHLDLGRIGWLVAAVSIGLGFGLQEIVANFVSGIILLVERPIRVGDVVTVGNLTGQVTRINIRATTVLNWDRLEILVPNRDLITKEVTNWTLADKVTRLEVPIGVAYGTDVDEVRQILLDLADAQPEILKAPAPQALFISHGESSLDFVLRIHLPETSLRMVMLDRLNTLINKELGVRGIEIPFPQRDVHLKSDGAAGAEGKLKAETASTES